MRKKSVLYTDDRLYNLTHLVGCIKFQLINSVFHQFNANFGDGKGTQKHEEDALINIYYCVMLIGKKSEANKILSHLVF